MKKISLFLTVLVLIFSLTACGDSSASTFDADEDVSESENSTPNEEDSLELEESSSTGGDHFVIVSYELEEYTSDYYKLYVKVMNNTDHKLTYESIHYRCLDSNNTVVNTMNACNQKYESCELDSGQACIQDNLFEYGDDLVTIEIDSYQYTDENGEFIEGNFSEKYVIDLTEFLKQEETEPTSSKSDSDENEEPSEIEKIMTRFVEAWSTTAPTLSMVDDDGLIAYYAVTPDNSSFYIVYTQYTDGTSVIKIAPDSLDETVGASDWLIVLNYMVYAVDTDMENTYDGMSIVSKVVDEGSATKNGISYSIEESNYIFTIEF